MSTEPQATKGRIPESACDVIPISASGVAPAADQGYSYGRGLLIAGAGDLTVTMVNMADGQKATIPVPAGQLSLATKKIWSSGSTATGVTVLV